MAGLRRSHGGLNRVVAVRMQRGRDTNKPVAVGSITWDQEWAQAYDLIHARGDEPQVLGPMVTLLAGLARGGPSSNSASGRGASPWR
jgi:hypothetical protein